MSPPKTCKICGGENLAKEVAVAAQNDSDSYTELQRECHDCGHIWTEAHQHGRFESVLPPSEREIKRMKSIRKSAMDQIKWIDGTLKRLGIKNVTLPTNPGAPAKTSQISCAPKVCPVCLRPIGKTPIACYTGAIQVGNTKVKYRCDVHKRCLDNFKFWDELAAKNSLTREIESLITREARSHPGFRL